LDASFYTGSFILRVDCTTELEHAQAPPSGGTIRIQLLFDLCANQNVSLGQCHATASGRMCLVQLTTTDVFSPTNYMVMLPLIAVAQLIIRTR
jgi:hypothetical protein